MRLKVLIVSVSIFLFSVSPSFAAIEFIATNPQINNDEITVDVSITDTSTAYYLQGLFTKPGETNYFGLTKNHYGDWFTSDATPNKDYITTNFFKTEPINSSWSGQLMVKNDLKNPNYKGPGDYELKIRRYTGNSTSTAGEATLIISFSSVTPTLTPTSTPTPTSTSAPTSTPTTPKPTTQSTPTSTKTPTSTPEITSTPQSEATTSDQPLVLGDITSSPDPEPSPTEIPSNNQTLLPKLITGLGSALVLSGLLALTYKFYIVPKKPFFESADDKISE